MNGFCLRVGQGLLRRPGERLRGLTVPPAPSWVPLAVGPRESAHLFGEPCEEVPATQEVQNKVELALGLEGWGEGKGSGGASWALGPALRPSSLGVRRGEGGSYGEGNSPAAKATAGRWSGSSGTVCSLTVVQLHHKRVVYVSKDVSLHLSPNTVTHWPEDEGSYQGPGHPTQPPPSPG